MKLFLIYCDKCKEKKPHFIYFQIIRGGMKLACDECGHRKTQYIKRNLPEYIPETLTKLNDPHPKVRGCSEKQQWKNKNEL